MRYSAVLTVLIFVAGAFAGCLDSFVDDDDDGFNNDVDNCIAISNADQTDTDVDGVGDACDEDDDDDGTLDIYDSFPLDPFEISDNDSDGEGDNADTDDDNDGYSDIDEEQNCDDDSSPMIASDIPPDHDEDKICDFLDEDDDGDGFTDSDDTCPFGIKNLISNSENDWDQDGCIDENEDDDDDNDGTPDSSDDFSFDFEAVLDTDGDGKPDELMGGIPLLLDSFEDGAPSSVWSTGGNGDSPWIIDSGLVAKDGALSLKSGQIPDNAESTLTLTMQMGEGNLTYWYRVSSEAPYDNLIFYFDGTEQNRWNGTVTWSFYDLPITAGWHTLTWTYEKDVSGAAGADSAWIDDVRIPISGPPTVSHGGLLLDMDDDGDGYSDADETTNCASLSDSKNPNKTPSDTDGDFLCNHLDIDDDNDGFNDGEDAFPLDSSEWLDTDGDGSGNNADDDDDNDGHTDFNDDFSVDPCAFLDTDSDGQPDSIAEGCITVLVEDDDDDNDLWSDEFEAACQSDPTLQTSVPVDTDGDWQCDLIDIDDDGDSVPDDEDLFPLDPTEWSDTDLDGEGDNSDTDDDNDLIPDLLDFNPLIDMAVEVTIGDIYVEDYVDFWDSYAELYFNITLDGNLMGYISDGGNTYSVPLASWFSVGQSISFDLPETQRYFWIGISAWDYDSGGESDDLLDLNPSSEYRTLYLLLDGTTGQIVNSSDYNSPSSPSSGSTDYSGDDDDMSAYYSVELFDMRNYESEREFTWYYDLDGDGGNANPTPYTFTVDLAYSDYAYWRSLDHSIEEWSDYGNFVTPNADYIQSIGDEFYNFTQTYGFSDTQIAEFVLGFVGSIDYAYDIDSAGMNEYPKYPIEMLWEENGDCEDATALYASIMEYLGFDVIVVLMGIQVSYGEEWGGHAIPLIHIDSFSGTTDYDGDGAYDTYGLEDSETGLDYYWAEATGFNGIGTVWWYDLEIWEVIDVEE